MSKSIESASNPSNRLPASTVESWQEAAAKGWLRWDPAAVVLACDSAGAQASEAQADKAYWRGLADFMAEGGDALPWLDRAWRAYAACGQGQAAGVTANVALVICLLDGGSMSGLEEWHARVDAHPVDETGTLMAGQWLRLGVLARVALGKPDSEAAAHVVAQLHEDMLPLQTALSPNERLLAALVLIEYAFAVSRFEQFDYLSNLVEHPALFEAAASLLRARWVFVSGFAHYQVSHTDRAEREWRRALALARESDHGSLALKVTLAMVRLWLDRGRVDEADRMLETLDPRWGAGRTAMLIELQQMRARVQVLRGQPARALVTLQEANQLAAKVGLSRSESAARQTDLAQIYIALNRSDEALALLIEERVVAQTGAAAERASCLVHLLRAWMTRFADPQRSRQDLERGLELAHAASYTMYFRLLPALAAAVSAYALQTLKTLENGLALQFVDDVIRIRQLPAPADADGRWPWPMWLNLLGSFEMRCDGKLKDTGGKAQKKPLELLRLLACARNLSIGTEAAMQALWPDSEDAAARKSFEMTALRLRRLMGDATLLRVGDGRVGLDATRASSDVQQRRRLIERIEALAMLASHAGEPDADHDTHDECLRLVAQVITLTRGELLAGLSAAPWLESERQACRNDTVRAALAAASVLERLQVGSVERELLEAVLRIEPLAESLVRRLMQAHGRAGQRGDALRVFESYRQQLTARGATPSQQIEAQWRALLPLPLSKNE